MANNEYWILSESYYDRTKMEEQLEKADKEGWTIKQFSVTEKYYVALMVRSKDETTSTGDAVEVLFPAFEPQTRAVVCTNSGCELSDESVFYCATEFCPSCEQYTLFEWEGPKQTPDMRWV